MLVFFIFSFIFSEKFIELIFVIFIIYFIYQFILYIHHLFISKACIIFCLIILELLLIVCSTFQSGFLEVVFSYLGKFGNLDKFV